MMNSYIFTKQILFSSFVILEKSEFLQADLQVCTAGFTHWWVAWYGRYQLFYCFISGTSDIFSSCCWHTVFHLFSVCHFPFNSFICPSKTQGISHKHDPWYDTINEVTDSVLKYTSCVLRSVLRRLLVQMCILQNLEGFRPWRVGTSVITVMQEWNWLNKDRDFAASRVRLQPFHLLPVTGIVPKRCAK